MPPKPKCTKEEIIKAVFEMTGEPGFKTVTTGEIGKKLGTSATPIFTWFNNMCDVRKEVCNYAMKKYENYVRSVLDYTTNFKEFGVKMVEFATKEPNIFRLICMQETDEEFSFGNEITELGETAGFCILSIMKDYKVSENEAKALFKQVWIYVFSICALLANNVCNLSGDEFSKILSLEFRSAVASMKSGNF